MLWRNFGTEQFAQGGFGTASVAAPGNITVEAWICQRHLASVADGVLAAPHYSTENATYDPHRGRRRVNGDAVASRTRAAGLLSRLSRRT